MANRLLVGDAEGGDRRGAVGRVHPDERGVDARNGGSRLEGAPKHLVQVDRPVDVAEQPAAAALLLGPGDRSAEIGRQVVQPPLDVRYPPGRPPQEPGEQPDEQDEDGAERRDRRNQGMTHGSVETLDTRRSLR